MTTAPTLSISLQLTRARKGLIRRAYRERGARAVSWLYALPSFQRDRISRWRIEQWAREMGLVGGAGDKSNIHEPRKRAGSRHMEVAPAPPTPPTEPTTGEWYTPHAVAVGLGVDDKRVADWQRLGWLPTDVAIFDRATIRAFVCAHRLEVGWGRLDESNGVWLVSILVDGIG